MRLFTAINLPEDVKRHLDSMRRPFADNEYDDAGLKLVRRDILHVTLKFLGDVEDDRLPRVLDALRAVSVISMKLFVDRFETFPRRGPIRVIAAGINGDVGATRVLHGSIENALEPHGFTRESREYTPHITLVRVRDGLPRNRRPLALGEAARGPEFVASSFELMRSDLKPTGPEYEILESFRS